MNIVVTSDTHLPKGARTLPEQLLNACKTADLIIHAGDWSTLDVYRELSQYAETVGVHGNMDGEEIRGRFPDRQVMEAKGFRIGIVHGHGEKKTTERWALETFADEALDVVIFGHSHIPYLRYHGKTLLLNPGSPTDKRKLPHHSYATLQIEDDLHAAFSFFK